MGNPSRVNPHGIEIVGSPKISKGCVLRSSGETPPGGGVSSRAPSAMVTAARGVVGVTKDRPTKTPSRGRKVQFARDSRYDALMRLRLEWASVPGWYNSGVRQHGVDTRTLPRPPRAVRIREVGIPNSARACR